jgi:MFS family permease
MGVATFLIGLLPGYAAIGIWAPVLLVDLRFLQGFGLGGEWGGAVLMATEHATAGRRGFYSSFPQMEPAVGFLLSSGLFLILTASLSESRFASWGWRIPFLFSVVLVAIGLYVRVTIAETPVFREAGAGPLLRHGAHLPAGAAPELWRHNPRLRALLPTGP